MSALAFVRQSLTPFLRHGSRRPSETNALLVTPGTRLPDERESLLVPRLPGGRTVATVCAVWSMGMDPLVAHHRAQETFADVLVNVTSDQLSSPTPCPEWDVKALVDHVIAGNQRVVERAGGQVAPLPEDLGAALRTSAETAQETFAEPEALTRTYQIPIGEVPGTAFIALRTSDLLTHAWDLAIATGQPTDLDPELAEYILAFSREMMSRPGLRGDGRPFGEEQPCGGEHPVADRVAAFLGRKLN